MSIIYDQFNKPISKVINLEPTFFSVLGSAQAAVSIADLEKQPFVYHAWTHACAWVIARNISGLPLRLLDKVSHEPIEDRWGLLTLLSNPNPVMTRTPFLQTIILGLILADAMRSTGGQVFITPRSASEKDKGKVNIRKGGTLPDVLLPFTTKYFTPVTKGSPNTSDTGVAADSTQTLQELTGWKFMIPGSPNSALTYFPEEIIRVHLVNPYEWLKGASSYTAARVAVMQDMKSDIYNNSFFDNNATPAGILTSDMPVTREQRQETMRSWSEEYGGSSNTGKIAVLGKGLRYERIALTHQDMQFMETKDYSLEQMIASFGINKIALGLYEDVNYATIKEARRWLWQDTYLPLARLILEAINSQWINYIDESIELAFDTSEVEALQLDYSPRIQAASQMVREMRVPPTMAMRINGVPYTQDDVKKYPWLDEQVVPFQPTQQSTEPSVKPPSKKPTMVEEDGEESKSFIFVTKDSKDKFSESFVKNILMPGEAAFERKLIRFFTSQENAMLDNLKDWFTSQKASPTYLGLSVKSILLNVKTEDEALKKVFTPLVEKQLYLSEKQLEKELGGLVKWGVNDPMIDKYIKARKKEIHSINSTTMDRVGDRVEATISKMLKDNASVTEVAAVIRQDILEGIETRTNQALSIARTEIGIVTANSRFDAMRTEGFKEHEWITSNDDKVRDSHVTAGEAGPVAIGELFPGVNLRFPLDPNGEAGEIINCRCVAVAVK